ncbi:MAG TPA: FAD-dependent oxidoreductase [Ktedonobacteraceae bacterium]
MQKVPSTVVIGAGPYGLAVSAYLREAGIPTLTFGKPMEFWRNMPAGLCLKSVWSASHLADPARKFSLENYLAAKDLPKPEPIPLDFFLNYGQWFQEQAVPEVDPTYVQMLTHDGQSFHLSLADGREISAARVIVATGIGNFTRLPDYARDLPPTIAAHTQKYGDLSSFQGRRVAMIGSGQSALEYAALLHEAGAQVEIIAREPFIWHSRILYERTGPARRIFYPPGDVGPPGINWLVSFPVLFSHLPDGIKQPVHIRATRPAGAKWLRSRVEGQIRLTPCTRVEQAIQRDQQLMLKLDDGTQREIDFLFLGTGYQADIKRLPFLDPALISQMRIRNGYPELNTGFESSVRNLHFVGALAGQTFGPVCRFLSGAPLLARQITRRAALKD